MFKEVNACFDKMVLDLDKLACVTTDGCPNVTGKRETFEVSARQSD